MEILSINMIQSMTLKKNNISNKKKHTTTRNTIVKRLNISHTLNINKISNNDLYLLRQLFKSTVQHKINIILNYTEDLVNAQIERGQVDETILPYYMNNDVGPFWTKDTRPPTIQKIKRDGCVCTGFINLLKIGRASCRERV